MPSKGPDSLPELRQRTVARLKALEPAIEEHRRLTAVLAAIDGDAPLDTSAPKPANPRRSSSSSRKRSAHRPREPHTQTVLKTLQSTEQPRSVRNLAEELNLDRRTVQNTLGHLRRQGHVTRSSEGWRPAATPSTPAVPGDDSPDSESTDHSTDTSGNSASVITGTPSVPREPAGTLA